jgi:hypothetical protein
MGARIHIAGTSQLDPILYHIHLIQVFNTEEYEYRGQDPSIFSSRIQPQRPSLTLSPFWTTARPNR